MRSVWKYELQLMDSQTILMPEGASILTVQMRHGVPCLWALVDDSQSKRIRILRIVGTGHPAKDVAANAYVGTFQLESGSLVFHVFEEERK